MKLLKYLKQQYLLLIGIIMLGTAIYLFSEKDTTTAGICFLFAICTWQYKDISDLSQRVYDLEIKNCDLELKINKIKWNIKD